MLTFVEYNKNSLIVRGDKEKYASLIKKLNGRWNSKAKGGEGWMVPNYKRKQLEELISNLNEENNEENKDENKFKKIDSLQGHGKERKVQKKYHRAISEDEYLELSSSSSSNDEDNIEDVEKESEELSVYSSSSIEEDIEDAKEVNTKVEEKKDVKPPKKNKKEVKKRREIKEDPILNYYKSFSRDPRDLNQDRINKEKEQKNISRLLSKINKCEEKLTNKYRYNK